MRHLPLVEWRARDRLPRQQAVLRESRQLQFDLHGEVQRPRLLRHHLPKVDAVGEDLINCNKTSAKGGSHDYNNRNLKV